MKANHRSNDVHVCLYARATNVSQSGREGSRGQNRTNRACVHPFWYFLSRWCGQQKVKLREDQQAMKKIIIKGLLDRMAFRSETTPDIRRTIDLEVNHVCLAFFYWPVIPLKKQLACPVLLLYGPLSTSFYGNPFSTSSSDYLFAL